MTDTIKQLFEDQTRIAKATEWKATGGLMEIVQTTDVQDGDILLVRCPTSEIRALLYGTKQGTIAVFEYVEGTLFGVICDPAYNGVEQLNANISKETFEMIIDGTIVNLIQTTEEETMSDKTETTTEKKTTGKFKGYARKAGKGLLYGAGAVAVAGGAYALYVVLKGAGAGEAAEAVGEAAGAAVSAAGEAVAETVAAWK